MTDLTHQQSQLRPFERCVMRLAGEGVATVDIAERFRRSPAFIGRVMDLTRLPGRAGAARTEELRPIERCILGWRARGAAHVDIAPRLRRSPDFVERVEALARYKLAAR